MALQESGTTIDLIRHGEPVGGVRFRGWLDDPLSDTGWEQMNSAVGDARPWDRIVTSPLRRCAEFATDLSGRLGIPITLEEGIKEMGFGDWEGRLPEELYRENPQRMADFWNDPVANPQPNGEPMTLFQSRVELAWQDMQIRYSGRHLLVVAHGGVNRMIAAKVLGIPLCNIFRIDIPYAAITRIRVDDGIPRLVFHNGTL
jgi:alpha-ribazole phosphatase